MEPRLSRTTMSSLNLISQLGLPTMFPVFFPPQIERYRRSIAEGADAPDEFAVGHMLAAAATAAGGDVSACVQPGWYVRANAFIALIGHKGSGKSTLADKCFAPLVHREEELKDAAARGVACRADEREDEDEEYDDGYGDDDDEDIENEDGQGDTCNFASRSRGAGRQPDPCLLVNDTTGPALLQLLHHNRRQLLVNADELSAQFARNTGGTDRQLWCELFDGRRRRRERASTSARSSTLAAPYVSLIGSIQPGLLKVCYNARGDDGLLDRMLLVGDGVMREAAWPRDADDPVLNTAWTTAMSRLLRIEERAEDAIGQQVESRFTGAALEVCQGLLARLNDLVVVLGVPNAQRGLVKKLIQHAVKLALLHRCLRWAASEFGEDGPLGDVDADDAVAAREAALFFFGRWLLWRKELLGHGATAAMTGAVGLSRAPGNDPVLQSLAAVASRAQRGVGVIERLVRLLRGRGPHPVEIAPLTAVVAMADVAPDELRDACDWLVDNGHAAWLDTNNRAIRLVDPVTRTERCPRELISSAKGEVK